MRNDLNDQRRYILFPVGDECEFVLSQVRMFQRLGCAMISDGLHTTMPILKKDMTEV